MAAKPAIEIAFMRLKLVSVIKKIAGFQRIPFKIKKTLCFHIKILLIRNPCRFPGNDAVSTSGNYILRKRYNFVVLACAANRESI